MKRPGLALILVVGVLAVLAVLGSAFAVMSRLERTAARQRLFQTKAGLLARSGLEDAQARLGAGQDPTARDNAYGGEDWLLDGDQGPGSFDRQQEVYHAGFLDSDSCPARHALRPSFFRREGGFSPARPFLSTIEGRQRGQTGALADGAYSVRVLEQGGFWINGGDPAQAPTAGYNPILKRILGTLAEALDRQDGTDDGLPVNQTDGEALVDLRPAGGWSTWPQVLDAALGSSAAKLSVLRPYLALEAWTDLKVVKPNFTTTGATPSLWQARASSYAPGPDGTTAPDFERGASRIVGRAPVDLSWARRRRPALLALIAGLRGAYIRYSSGSGWFQSNTTVLLNWASATDDCRIAADAILACTSELRSWDQVNALLDAIPMTGATSEIRQAKRDILKANFNPNTDLNKLNPDPAMARMVDKQNLMAYSTEFNLVPRGGWRIASAGRLHGAGGRILASKNLSLETRQDPMVRLTTQGELVAEDLGDLDRAGDEGAFRSPGSSPFITESQGDRATFAHRLSLGGYLDGSARGASLQTLPETHLSPPACYDGQLRLATLETADGEDYQPAPVAGSLKLLSRWSDRWDADLAGGDPTAVSGFCVEASGTYDPSALPPPAARLMDPAQPNTLFTDGVYLEPQRILGYRAAGNMAPHRGVLSFWIKPRFEECLNTASLVRRHVYFSNGRWDGGEATALHWFGWNEVWGGMHYRRFVQHWEGVMLDPMAGPEDVNEQFRCSPEFLRITPGWRLVTLFWDMGDTGGDTSSRVLLDRGRSDPLYPEERNTTEMYNTWLPSTSLDFTTTATAPGIPATLFLGPGGFWRSMGILGTWGDVSFYYPHATMDEFAVYDFGSANATALVCADQLARARFEAGRFYKESAYPASGGLFEPPGLNRSAGEWFSAPIPLDRMRLLSLAWTQSVPRTFRSPLPPAPAAKPEDGDEGPEGRILFELADPAVQVPAPLGGKAYAADSAGREIRTVFRDASGERVDRLVPGPFRLHAVFQPNLASLQEKAILDPLVLDDVTLVYRDPARTCFASWTDAED